MVKGIVNAFDHMEFCYVLNLTATFTDGKWADIWPPIFTTRYVSFAINLNTEWQVLLLAKKLISNTDFFALKAGTFSKIKSDISQWEMVFCNDVGFATVHCKFMMLSSQTLCYSFIRMSCFICRSFS